MRSKITVLVIEDDGDDFFLMTKALHVSDEIDFNIIRASSLTEAFPLADDNGIDVATIDLSLPDSSGLETFLRFHTRYPGIPAVIMTGNKDKEAAFEAIRMGAQEYLYKGEISGTAIIRTLRYSIERQRLVTELQVALDHVQQLQGLLPICSICKNIRDDKGYWNEIAEYLSDHSELKFSHGICPNCVKKYYSAYAPTTPDDSAESE